MSRRVAQVPGIDQQQAIRCHPGDTEQPDRLDVSVSDAFITGTLRASVGPAAAAYSATTLNGVAVVARADTCNSATTCFPAAFRSRFQIFAICSECPVVGGRG
jgi:hypothetical protein